jgi:glycerol-3-phosphate acyltransferase PlsX
MIALDVMGGDYAPGPIIQGALQAAHSVPVLLVGPQDIIKRELYKLDPLWERLSITIHHAPDIITMAEEPVQAVRNKKFSSLVQAVMCVKEGRATGVISAGNSGALMAAALFILGREEQYERPAIISFLPNYLGTKLLALDLGANTECRPGHLYQFAHMGVLHAQKVLGIERPRVGLLSNGHEDSKGSLLVKETFGLLKQSSLNFVGNVEPYGIFSGKVDLVVCDGFSGNVLLKTMESVFSMTRFWLEQMPLPDEKTRIWRDSFIEKTNHYVDSRWQGGALLLGVKGTVVVCHGSSDARTIEHALYLAQKYFQPEIKTGSTQRSFSGIVNE